MQNNGMPRLVKYFNLIGEFNDELVERFYEFYIDCIEEGVDNAVILISSVGGSVHSAIAMIELMNAAPIKFYGVNTGTAYSAALTFLANCDFRFGTPGADYIFHEIRGGAQGTPDEVMVRVESMQRLQNDFMKTFAKRTFYTLPWWLEQCKNISGGDFQFTSQEALDMKVIDFIGFPNMQQDMIPEVYPYTIDKDRKHFAESIVEMREAWELPPVLSPSQKADLEAKKAAEKAEKKAKRLAKKAAKEGKKVDKKKPVKKKPVKKKS